MDASAAGTRDHDSHDTHDTPARAGSLAARLRTDRRWIAVEWLLILALYLVADRLLDDIGTVALVLLGWLSLRLRRQGWRTVGLRRPDVPRRAVALGVGGGIALFLLVDLGLDRLVSALSGQELELGSFAQVEGDPAALAFALLLVWILAAFGEELAYRGYWLNRTADLVGRTPAGWAVAIAAVSIVFGFAHAYQGPVGVVSSAVTGAGYALVYLAADRNLWASILAHGVANTCYILMIFAGLSPTG